MKNKLTSAIFSLCHPELDSGSGCRNKFGMTILFIFVLFTSTILGPSVALAIESEKIAIYPTNFQENNPKTRSWFILNLSAGQKISEEVTIQNKGNQEVRMEIYAVDGSSNPDGAFTLSEKNTRQDVGGWVSLPLKSVIVPANSKISLPFTVTIPSLATPGDHVGGIAVEENNDSGLLTSGVKLIKRTGVRIYITVDGQKSESLEIKNLHFVQAPGGTYLYYTANNTGNTNLSLVGNVEFKSILGATDYNPIPLGEILAGKSITAKILANPSNLLSYSGGINISYGKNGHISKSVAYLSPSLIFPLILIALTIGLLIFIRLKKTKTFKRLS